MQQLIKTTSRNLFYRRHRSLHQQDSVPTTSQPVITYSKLAIETLEQGVKYVQS